MIGADQGPIEVRLIFDPINTTVARPNSDVAVSGLDETIAVREALSGADFGSSQAV